MNRISLEPSRESTRLAPCGQIEAESGDPEAPPNEFSQANEEHPFTFSRLLNERENTGLDPMGSKR